MLRFLTLLLMLMVCAALANAQERVVKVYAGANTVSFDGATKFPSDYELGGSLRASLSPHISLVGSGWHGLGRSYNRASGGVRVTATDIDNNTFSCGFGIQYQISDNHDIRPEEWCPDATAAWRPWANLRKVSVGLQGNYGLTSNQASLLAAVRYELAGF